MIINFEDKCRCSHNLGSHTSSAPYDEQDNIQFEKALQNPYWDGCGKCTNCKKFQLSNLKYLEYLYEQRNLV